MNGAARCGGDVLGNVVKAVKVAVLDSEARETEIVMAGWKERKVISVRRKHTLEAEKGHNWSNIEFCRDGCSGLRDCGVAD